MKKLLTTVLLFASAVIFVPSTEAKTGNSNLTANNAADPQINVRIGQPRRNNRRARVVNRTRIVRQGFRTYRETIQTRYQPNGRVTTRVISRVRIR